jgi:proteasome lid subunit RPN8/RPN11
MLFLTSAVAAQIRLAGERAYPNEGCGAMLGELGAADSRSITEIIPLDNSREDGEQYHRFRIEPEDILRVEKTARQKKLDVLGFYHSHPDHPAAPSDYDRDHALPFYSYVIVAVEQGAAAVLTSWNLANDRSEFVEEQLRIQN